MRRLILFSTLILHFFLLKAQTNNSFVPGQLWLDDKGVHINAHGGGILIYNNKYYWFGEHKTEGEGGNNSNVGVHVYSSSNLTKWKDEGIALKMLEDTTSLLVKGSIVERPKVIYNKKTKKFVMWFHHELKGQGYKAALTGLAISDKVTGPYKYIKSLNPNAGVWPLNFPEALQKINATETMEGIKMQSPEGFRRVKDGFFVRRDFAKGQMARDMTLYVDDDGKAYHIHSSENNQTLHFSELTDDYQGFTGRYTRVLEGKANEAPAIFKRNGKYYMISSGTTGWKPNPARISVADQIMGPWRELGDPSRGSEDQIKTTFWSQSTFIVPVIGKEDAFIYMGDRWTPENAIDGRYIWLPIEFENNQPILRWYNEWDLSVFDKKKLKGFSPGKVWLDNNGVAINAHGGNIIYHQKRYYWYGEHKMVGKSEAQFADSGIHCYSSSNLMDWKDEGMALTVSFADTTSDLAYGCILERPKVIYDQRQKLFTAYFKYYPRGTGYLKGYIGVATSNTPIGPFTYKHKFLGGSPEYGSGDFSMYEDSDKKIYHLTVRKPDKTFVIGQLQENKLLPEGKYEPVKGIALHTEAPALILHDNKYYLIGSGSSGWKPNKARSFVADSLKGEFKDLGNPCIGVNPYNGIGADTTFGGQISYILKIEGKKNAYIAMFDVWKPNQPINGLYIWLPLVFKNGKPTITWKDHWSLNIFD